MNDSSIARTMDTRGREAAESCRSRCSEEDSVEQRDHEGEESCASLIHSPDGSCGPLGSYALCVYVSTTAPWTYRIVRRLRAVLSAGTRLASSRESGNLRPCLFVRYSSCRVNPLSLLKKSMSTIGVSYTCFYNRVTIPYVPEKGVVDSLLGELLSLACVTFDSDPIDAFDSNGFPILSVYSVRPPPFSHTYLWEQRYCSASRGSRNPNVGYGSAECKFTELLSVRNSTIGRHNLLERSESSEEQSRRFSSPSIVSHEKIRSVDDDRARDEQQRLRDREYRRDRSARNRDFQKDDGEAIEDERRRGRDDEDLCGEETKQRVDEQIVADATTRFRAQIEPLDLCVRRERAHDYNEDRVSEYDRRRFLIGRRQVWPGALFDLTDFVGSYFVRSDDEDVSIEGAAIVSNDATTD